MAVEREGEGEPPVMRQDEYGPHWLAVRFGGDAAGDERGGTPITTRQSRGL